MSNVETKVIAAASGAGLGGAVGGFLLWLLGVLVWGQGASAGNADKAIAAVPSPVAAVVLVLISVIGAAIAGYSAPHTSRPDLAQPAVAAAPDVVKIETPQIAVTAATAEASTA